MTTLHPRLNPHLRGILTDCHQTATAYGIPMEVALGLLLSLGSAIAGSLITYDPDGSGMRPSTVSSVTFNGDATVPAFFTREIDEILRRQELVAGKPTSPLEDRRILSSLERQRDANHLFEAVPGLASRAVEMAITFAKNRKQVRTVRRFRKGRLSTFKLAPAEAVVVETAFGMRAILRAREQEKEEWTKFIDPTLPVAFLGCLGAADWVKVSETANIRHLLAKAWLVGCPAGSVDMDSMVQPELLGESLLHRLEVARFGGIKFKFTPPAQVRELLDRQVGQFREVDREVSSFNVWHLPETDLAWKYSAILAALCCEGIGDDLEESFVQATQVGCAMAAWTLRQHVHHRRTWFPSTPQGCVGIDRRLHRFLTPVPSPVRPLQRKLRGVSRETCVAALQRLVGAHLASEPTPGHFAKPDKPADSPELSEFLTAFDPKQIFPLRPDPRATDSTDNAATNPSPSITPKQGGDAGI